MIDKSYGIFSFESAHYATAAEEVSSELPEARLIPIPPELSAGCGLALRVDLNNIEKTIQYLNDNNIPFEKVNKLEIKNRERIISSL